MNLAGHSLKLSVSPRPKATYQIKENSIYKTIDKIYLHEPELNNCGFFDILNKRETRRDFVKPLGIAELSSLLWHSLRVKKIDINNENIVTWNHMGVISAGGLASVDTFITNIEGYEKKIFYYNRYDHSLEELDIKSEVIEKIFEESNKVIESGHGTLFLYASQTKKLFSKYENPESLLWKDVGAIYMTINLVSEAFSLKSCALGITFEKVVPIIANYVDELCGLGGQVIGK